MGRIACTRDGVSLDEHEGYVSALLDDGSSARGAWNAQIARHITAWRAECSCGWAGPPHDLGWDSILQGEYETIPDDGQYDTILIDWERDHAHPLVVAAEKATQLHTLSRLVDTFDAQSRAAVTAAFEAGASWEDIIGVLRLPPGLVRARYQPPARRPLSTTGRPGRASTLG